MRTLMLTVAILAAVSAPTAAADQAAPTPEPPDTIISSATTSQASDALLTSIVTWLSTNFDLKPTVTLPKVKHLSATAMTQRRYRTFLGVDGSSVSPSRLRPYHRGNLRSQRRNDLPAAGLDGKNPDRTLRPGPRNGSSPAEYRTDEIRVPTGARATGICRAATVADLVRSHAGRGFPDRPVHAVGDDPLHALNAARLAKSGLRWRTPLVRGHDPGCGRPPHITFAQGWISLAGYSEYGAGMSSAPDTTHLNRLAQEASPYLLQHSTTRSTGGHGDRMRWRKQSARTSPSCCRSAMPPATGVT